jgi:hypothetical protein
MMKRHYYISENLDDLEDLESELEANGIPTPQIHVLSEKDAEVESYRLNEVEAVMKKDVIQSTERGALVGLVVAVFILAVAYFTGLTETAAGWVPFIFLAVVALGFCTWEGGFFGIQKPHEQVKRFRKALSEGKHVFFVDAQADQESVLEQVVQGHPQLQVAGMGKAAPAWVVNTHNNWRKFIKAMP